METINLTLDSIGKTKELAVSIAKNCSAGDVITLRGNLGSGKTTFSQHFINYFIEDAVVTSPTFNIVQIYKNPNITIWHFDLHRLNSLEDTYEIGLDEALNEGITLIEWPEIVLDTLSGIKADIRFEYNKDKGSRLATIEADKTVINGIMNV